MRIIYLVESFPIISETFVLNQITGMIDKGHDVSILSWSRSEFEKKHPTVDKYRLIEKTIYSDDHPDAYLRRIFKFISLVLSHILVFRFDILALAYNSFKHRKKLPHVPFLNLFYSSIVLSGNKPDVIHCQFGSLGPRGLLLKQICSLNSKLITSFRGADATKFIQDKPGYYNELFIHGDLFLPVSNSLKRRIIELGCDKSKIHVLHSGIRCSLFDFRPRQLPGDGVIRIITVARLVEKKGVCYAIKAAGRLICNNYKIKYNIAGDGNLREELETLIYDLGVEREVHILGWKNHDEILSLLRDAHILLAPSVTSKDGDQEGIPNVIKEAMALGIPVVSTYHSGIPELVEDGVTGFLVPERDVNALAEKVAYLCDNADIWSRLAEAARKRVETEFDNDELNVVLEKIYIDLSV